MIKLDLQINSLDGLFSAMQVHYNPPVEEGKTPTYPSTGYFFSLTGPIGKWKSIYAVPKPEIRATIEQWCCDARIGSIQPKEQWGGSLIGLDLSNIKEYAIIASDDCMISSIRVCLMPRDKLTFKGIDVLQSDLPLGIIGG